MARLTNPLDIQVFISQVELLDRNRRLEYIFENMHTVPLGNQDILGKYAVEALQHWEARCTTMLELSSPDELYRLAFEGALPPLERREKEAILRLARSLCNYSKFHTNAGADHPTLNTCLRAEALLQHIHHKHELLSLYIHLPHAMRKMNHTIESIMDINRKALTLAAEVGDHELEMQVLNNLGRFSELYPDFPAAHTYYVQTLAKLDLIILENNAEDTPSTLPDEYLLPKTVLLYNIANCLGIMGNVREALSTGSSAAAYARRLPPSGIAVNIEQLLARGYSILGANHTAIEHIIRAGQLAELMNSEFLVSQTKMFAAVVYSNIGDYPKAIANGFQAIAGYRIHESVSEYVVVSARVCGMLISAGELSKAQNLCRELLTVLQENDSNENLIQQKSLVLRQIARIAVQEQRWQEALDSLQLPLSLLDSEQLLPHIVIETLVIATNAYIGLRHDTRAYDLANKTLATAIQINDLRNQHVAHLQLTSIAELRGDYAAAYHHHKEFHRIKEMVFNNESDQRNKNMMLLLEEQEAQRIAQAERLRRFELEAEIGQLSTSLVHQEQALKEIRSTIRTMKSTPNESEQIINVLQSLLRSTENATKSKTTKTYKQLDEKIEHAFPTLSRVQREVCRFIALGHTTKDIAGLMNISVQSVNTQRYRIRTRLEMPEHTSLDAIIKQTIK